MKIMTRNKILVGLIVVIAFAGLITISVFFSSPPPQANDNTNEEQVQQPQNEEENQKEKDEEKEEIPVGLETGQKAPDFTLSNMENEETSLSDYRGQKVFLNFWATWCPPCRIEMPDMQKLYTEHEDITVLAVNLQEDKDTVSDFLVSNKLTFPVVLDKNREVGNEYLIRSIPTTFILDENGIIRDKHIGALTYDSMLEKMNFE